MLIRVTAYRFLAKVTTRRCEIAEQGCHIKKPPSDQVLDLAVSLPDAMHAEQRRAKRFLTVPLQERWPNYDIYRPAFGAMAKL